MAASKYILIVASVGLHWFSDDTCAQSLFNSRGSTGQSQSSFGSQLPGSMFSNPTGSQSSALGPSQPGSFIGRGSQANRFVGRQQPSGVATGEPRSNNSSSRQREGTRREVVPSRGAESASTQQRSETTSSRPVIRPRYRVAFEFAPVSAEELTEVLASRFADFSIRRREFAEIKVAVNSDRTIALSGTVPSDETRILAALVARFEPGVSSVTNQLVVATKQIDD